MIPPIDTPVNIPESPPPQLVEHEYELEGTPQKLPPKLGRFKILEHLGAGAFGAVYRAHDPMLDREVALKVPHAFSVQDEESAARFLREAKASAQLTHPNIVPIYDAGFDGGHFFIASKFIEGHTLDFLIKSQKLNVRQAARIVIELAGALAYAHEQDIVHRDIKPANIMLDNQGKPHLLDFGLAQYSKDQEKLTKDGSLLGTPAYMSPEQASGGTMYPVGPLSDQYSLGVVLYELLCGERAFEGPVQVVIYNVLKMEPRTAANINRRIPKDLDTICQKAMSKEPTRRYIDCAALADDLRHWQKNEPIAARRVKLSERLIRWCRRNPMLAGLEVAAVALLITVAVVSAIGYFTTRAALNEAERQTELAQRHLYASDMNHVQHAWDDDQLQRSIDLLEKHRPNSTSDRDYRGFEWFYWQHLLGRPNKIAAHSGGITCLAISKDGKTIVSGSNDNTVKLWNKASGKELLTLAGHTGGITCVAITSDGLRVASGSSDNTLRIWDARTGHELMSLKHPYLVKCLAFSPDGNKVVSGSFDPEIKIWDLTARQESLKLKGHTNEINCVAFSVHP